MKTDTTPNEAAASVIDTSKMSPEQRAALELTEAAREVTRETFAGGLFLGRLNLAALHPFPQQSHEDRDQGDAFLSQLETFLRDKTDPDEIDATGEIPQSVIDGLAKLGAFGIKVPAKYGGLGL
ncbi:MAG: acyl-CoA dehydrogenase family protein, partial [Chthoniobacteraceae bacterium]